MSTSVMVIVIVAIVVSGIVRIARIIAGNASQERERGIIRNGSGDVVSLPQDDDSRLREIAELRERIRVLERIATEEHKPQRLAAEIESLRDQ